MTQVQATIAGNRLALDSIDVERRLSHELPEPVDDHYVVVAGKRFPPKQAISLITGLDRADFNSHQARRVLSRLGFTVGRRSSHNLAPVGPGRREPRDGREADALRPYVGQWVAQSGLEVLVAAGTPQAVLAWLEQHNQYADAMFRVPVDSSEATGMAPL